eukprot:TRINITY_DN3938_c0_g1_i2.p1 TRINITY_DN3938_c0_g1~~TRINITY_DN3938_c0_g1_i2.p1  ORF type:complete len:501 (-),score=121.97 TRINITY_DN3938_c0_g1_i2:41-1543(-)
MAVVVSLAVFFVLQILTHLCAFLALVRWRKQFPISQRKPAIVLLQIVQVCLMGAFILLFPAFLNSSVRVTCFAYNFTFFALFYSVFLVVIIRVLILWNLEMQTRLINRFHGLSHDELEKVLSKGGALGKLKFWYYRKRRIFDVPLFLGIGAIAFVEAAVTIFGLFNNAPEGLSMIRGTTSCISLISTIVKANAFRIVIMLTAFAVLLFHVWRVKENFGLVSELKGLVAVALGLLAYNFLSSVIFPSLYGTDFHFFVLGFLLESLWLGTAVVPALLKSYKWQLAHPVGEYSTENNSGFSSSNTHFANSASGLVKRTLCVPQGHKLFYEFLQREFALENILFWDASFLILEEFGIAFAMREVNEKDWPEMQATAARCLGEASKVISEYIAEDSMLCVNVSADTRSSILAAHERCQEITSTLLERRSSPEFLEAFASLMKTLTDSHKEITKLMARDTFIRFKETPEFAEFSKEFLPAEEMNDALISADATKQGTKLVAIPSVL